MRNGVTTAQNGLVVPSITRIRMGTCPFAPEPGAGDVGASHACPLSGPDDDDDRTSTLGGAPQSGDRVLHLYLCASPLVLPQPHDMVRSMMRRVGSRHVNDMSTAWVQVHKTPA
jgi:hypothetical protein